VRCRDDQMAMASVCCMVAVGVNASGRREVLGSSLRPPRTEPAGPGPCAGWAPAALRACSW
jgi:hypothetical protein